MARTITTNLMEQGTETVSLFLPEQIYIDESQNASRVAPYSMAEIKAFAKEIVENGQLQPIEVRPWSLPDLDPDGNPWPEDYADSMAARTVTVVFGYGRALAIQYANDSGMVESPMMVRAIVRDTGGQEAISRNGRENTKRKPMGVMDKAKYAKTSREAGAIGKEIAAAMGVSGSMVTQYISLTKLIPELQGLLDSGDLNIADGYKLSGEDEASQLQAYEARLAELQARAEADSDNAVDAGGKGVKGGKGGKGKKRKKASPAVEELASKRARSASTVRKFYEGLAEDEEQPETVVNFSKLQLKFMANKIGERAYTNQLSEMFT